jgi:hypothetical protein
MSNRLERLKGYSKPLRSENWQGESRQQYIDRWSDRASEESQLAPRASGTRSTNGEIAPDLDPPRAPSSGAVANRDTSMRPREARKVDRLMAGDDDLNHIGSGSYLPEVRRKA